MNQGLHLLSIPDFINYLLTSPANPANLTAECVAEQITLAVKVQTKTEMIDFIYQYVVSCHGMVHDSRVLSYATVSVGRNMKKIKSII